MRIIITPYDARWPGLFRKERDRIAAALSPLGPEIAHIGSTAVPDLAAKPTIDIMIGLDDFAAADDQISRMEAIGYDYWDRFEDVFPDRRLFCLEKAGERLVNVHMVGHGSPFWVRHLLFRDILRQDKKTRKAYEALKRELAKHDWNERSDYAEAKTEFIEGVVARAEVGR